MTNTQGSITLRSITPDRMTARLAALLSSRAMLLFKPVRVVEIAIDTRMFLATRTDAPHAET